MAARRYRPLGYGRTFVVKQALPDAVAVGLIEHGQVPGHLHRGRALGPHLEVRTVDLTPHRGDDETGKEREHESDNAEGEPYRIVVLVSFGPEPMPYVHLGKHGAA